MVLLNNAVAVGEAKPGARFRALGREERVEDARQHLGVYAVTVVFHLDDDVVARRELGLRRNRIAVERLLSRAQADATL